jgi:hypothetical protein
VQTTYNLKNISVFLFGLLTFIDRTGTEIVLVNNLRIFTNLYVQHITLCVEQLSGRSPKRQMKCPLKPGDTGICYRIKMGGFLPGSKTTQIKNIY